MASRGREAIRRDVSPHFKTSNPKGRGDSAHGAKMFRVGASCWSLLVAKGPLVVNGAACDGACDERQHQLRLCHRLPADQRLHVVLHELAHAHIFSTGYPQDVESLCDFVATVGELAIRDLTACGGEEMLKRLRPGEVLKGSNGRIGSLRTRTCGRCQGTVAPADVTYGADADATETVTVAAYCDHCGITVKWRERATFGGAPSGEVIGEPVIEAGRTL